MRWSSLLVLICLSQLALLPVFAVDEEIDDDMDIDDADIQDDKSADVEEPPKPKEKIEYKTPKPTGSHHFFETFDDQKTFSKRWVFSQAKKDGADAAISKYDGTWLVEEAKDGALTGDLGLVLASKAKHHAVAAKLDKPYEFTSETMVVQYDVRFTNGQECGGAYVKLLSHDKKLSMSQFTDKTPYTIMFGPDKCGNDHKMHFIFRHKNPITGKYEEKHAKKPSGSIDSMFTDKKTHLLTLVINSDNTYQVYLDQSVINSGSLLEDMNPPVNPPKDIVDPNDKKPADWDDREKIPDPDAKKPDDWDESAPKQIPDESATKPDGWLDDEPELIPDPEAEKPSDWDDEIDGEWEAAQITNPKCKEAPGCGEWQRPMMDNPEYKGKWKPPMIDNPEYKGKWSPRMIANPEYFEDNEPWRMTPIGAVGLELWSMSDGIIFDNFIITNDKKVADDLAKDSWELKSKQEGSGLSGKSVVDYLWEATEGRPWLWAVYVAVVVLPILGIYQLIRPRNRTTSSAVAKKTDEAQPDDAVDADNEQEDDQDAAGGDSDSKENKSGKSALESKDDDADDGEAAENAPRKRKPRKD